MTTIYPGSAHIRCYAYLAHARFEAGVTVHSFILDGVIPAMQFGLRTSFFTGSFRFRDYADIGSFRRGVYLVEATIAQFVPHTHRPSATLPDSEFSFIGDLITVDRPLGSLQVYHFINVAPATVHCSGYVFLVDESSHSFLVTVWQKIVGIVPLTPLTVRAILSVCDCVDRPYQSLPQVGSVTNFRGELLTVDNGITVLAVRDHSYFEKADERDYEEKNLDVFT
ncbi:hypothetical protein V8E53_004484 [Lactarius tabidus]